MNMTCCAEHCQYQQDGVCMLPPGAPVGARVNGCCYFKQAAEALTAPCADTAPDHRQ